MGTRRLISWGQIGYTSLATVSVTYMAVAVRAGQKRCFGGSWILGKGDLDVRIVGGTKAVV